MYTGSTSADIPSAHPRSGLCPALRGRQTASCPLRENEMNDTSGKTTNVHAVSNGQLLGVLTVFIALAGFGVWAVDSKFDALDSRFDAMDIQFEATNTRIDDINSRIDSLNSRIDSLETRFQGLQSTVHELSIRVARMEGTLGIIVDEVVEQPAATTDNGVAQQ